MIQNAVLGTLLTICTSLILKIGTCQDDYKPGYYISLDSHRIEGYVPANVGASVYESLKFRRDKSGSESMVRFDSIIEFGITGKTKFIIDSFDIDRTKVGDHDWDRNPKYKKERITLEVILEGRASLYLYQTRNLTRFYFSTAKMGITPLDYKPYLVMEKRSVLNTNYRQQLYANLICDKFAEKDFKNLEYRLGPLTELFLRYNRCAVAKMKKYRIKKDPDLISLNLRIGLNQSSLKSGNITFSSHDMDFGRKYGPRIGLEFEYLVPSLNRKWAVIFEPYYQWYNGKTSQNTTLIAGGSLNSEIRYESIELTGGVRHNYYVNDDAMIFTSLLALYSLEFGAFVQYTRNDGSELHFLEVNPKPNFGFGIGYRKSKFSAEFRYHTKRDLLGGYTLWKGEYRQMSLILAYTIL